MKKLTKQQLSAWSIQGTAHHNRYMLICCDTFNYDYYPVYVHRNKTASELRAEIMKYDGRNMQRVMEVYDLQDAKLRDNIMGTKRMWQVPK